MEHVGRHDPPIVGTIKHTSCEELKTLPSKYKKEYTYRHAYIHINEPFAIDPSPFDVEITIPQL